MNLGLNNLPAVFKACITRASMNLGLKMQSVFKACVTRASINLGLNGLAFIRAEIQRSLPCCGDK